MKRFYYLLTVLLAIVVCAVTAYALTAEEMLLLKRGGISDKKILEIQKKEKEALETPAQPAPVFDKPESGELSKNYSIKIESLIENVLLDGLPEGVSITNVNNALLRKINNKLSTNGMNNNTNIINKAKLKIEYFGHKYIPFSNVKYGIKYNLELSSKLNGKVFYSQRLEAWDSNLDDLTDEIANDIIKNILKNERHILAE